MSSFNADKKREHESLAEKALAAGDYAKAFFHTAQAAECTFTLAEKSEGDIAKAYLEDANGLVDIAAGLKERVSVTECKTNKEYSGEEGTESASKGKWIVSSVGDIRMEDVKGLTDAKAVVTDLLINPVNNPDLYKSQKVYPCSCLLLYGPPGTGKTMFAKAIANEINATFMHVKLNKLKSKYVGDTEANITEMFRETRLYEKCVLFLDGCESMLHKRGNQKVRMVEQLLFELGGFKNPGGHQLFVVLATNRPWMLDEVLFHPHAIEWKVYFGLPEKETRRLIIDSALKDVPLASDVDLDKLADLTEGYSGAEISHKENGGGVCDHAHFFAARRWIERCKGLEKGSEDWKKKVEPVTWQDFEQALKSVVPTSKRDAEITRKNLAYRDSGGNVGDDSGDDD